MAELQESLNIAELNALARDLPTLALTLTPTPTRTLTPNPTPNPTQP